MLRGSSALFSLFLLFWVLLFVISCDSRVTQNKDLSRKFTSREKMYFLEIAFSKESKHLTKFDNSKSLSYSIRGAFDNREIVFIRNFIFNLNQLKNVSHFKVAEKNADIELIMPSSLEEFNSLNNFKEPVHGFCTSKRFFKGYLSSNKIIIKPFQSELDIEITIQHEFMHALGLVGHPKPIYNEATALGKRYFSVTSSFDTISPVLPNLDRKALCLLYSKAIPIHSTIDNVAKLLGVKKCF